MRIYRTSGGRKWHALEQWNDGPPSLACDLGKRHDDRAALRRVHREAARMSYRHAKAIRRKMDELGAEEVRRLS